jgi:orotate phosphoribosyltransferase
MKKAEILTLLTNLHVLREGHFLLTSGRHSDRFLLCSQLTMHPDSTELLIQELAPRVAALKPTVILGPAMGGVILAYELARALGCRAMFAEKDGEKMAMKRGFVLTEEDRVVIIEDAVSTGGSIRKVVDVVQQSPSTLVGVAALFDRTAGQVQFEGVPFISLMEIEITSYEPDQCPLCQANHPLVKPKS